MKKLVFAGIDIGGTNIKIALVGPFGRVLARGVIATLPELGPHAALQRVGSALPFLKGRYQEIAGAGIGCAGLVEAGRGVLVSSPNLPTWKEVPLRRLARRLLRMDTCIDNDANAAAYGEYRRGAGRGCSCFICITLGTGVGGGIVCNGGVLRGARNLAGEIGHMTISEGGPRCACGNRGCLEAFVGARALVASARRKLKSKGRRFLKGQSPRGRSSITPRAIAEAAALGDRVAAAVLDEAARHLGCAIASLVNIFNPEAIAIGGGISGALDLMRSRLEREVEARAFVSSASAVEITRTRLGNDSSTVGAAMMARDRLL